MMNAHRTEKGQALVLIILAVVGMLGFAALAVDLGRVYAERRRAQSAADTAAFAAAFAASEASRTHVAITESQLMNIALQKAQLNGVEPIAGTDPANPRVAVTYFHPPVSGPYVGNKEYHQLKIDMTVDQAFSQFVFSGLQRFEVEAVARARPVQSIFPGDALHATNPSECDAMWFAGSGDTVVNGGNVFSNSDGKGGSCSAGQQNGSGAVNVNGGGIVTAGDFDVVGGSGTVSPAPTTGEHKDNPDLPTPDCSGLHDWGSFSATGGDVATISPGMYSEIKLTGGKTTMLPGMYCLNGDFTVNGGAELYGPALPHPTPDSKGVLIVMLSGSIDFLGGGKVNLYRPGQLTDPSGNSWGGMLIFMPENNHGGVDIGGSSGSSYYGTIYAPGPRDSSAAKCRVSGSGTSLGLSSNVICNTVKVEGNAQVTINFNEQENYRMPPIIEMAQ